MELPHRTAKRIADIRSFKSGSLYKVGNSLLTINKAKSSLRRQYQLNHSTNEDCQTLHSPSVTTGSDDDGNSFSHLPKSMVAAMAMSPFAALSLPLVSDPAWQQSAQDFMAKVRASAVGAANSDAAVANARQLDDNLTFMEWTYKYTGFDLSYVWDPELWVRFREAIKWDDPQHFWNKLYDRIMFRMVIPQAGFVGEMRISYAKFLSLLETNRIKRLVVYGDMKTAIVEVPHPWYASIIGAPGSYPFFQDNEGQPLGFLVPNPDAPDDPTQWFCPEMPEWNMEKYRFYVDLPGDFWENGPLLDYLKSRQVNIEWDAASREFVMPMKYFNKVFEVNTELQVLDPTDSWDFMAWLTEAPKVSFYEKAAGVCIFLRLLQIAITFVTGTSVFQTWKKKKDKKSKEQSVWERLSKPKAREFMTKDKSGKVKDTNVRFADIAGMENIVAEMREVVRLLLRDPQYTRLGAKCPRGVIFQGPPGTGKTYLARAIAGEAGVPFFSSVGSEFVEMYAGVAAARVNNLFKTARERAPAIIFIDEIDAIGRSRSMLGSDPGSMERESALLAMLVAMDGIHGRLEQVLTIGATNLASDLDQALLRPGRFEVVYEIPAPGPVARLEILKYHARNKNLESENILVKVAEVAGGWSAASLANLMNEAAILTVRRGVEKISLPMMLELVENANWGPKAGRIPPSEAKDRLALVTAAKAVAFALTPGVEPIKYVTMWSRKPGVGPMVEFDVSDESRDPRIHPEQVDINAWRTNYKINAAEVGDEKVGEFLQIANMLLPLYAPRAAELEFFGADGASLASAQPISDCFELAYYCVRNSMLHPKFRKFPPFHTYIFLGDNKRMYNPRDPLAVGLDQELGYHALAVRLLKASWARCRALVAARRNAIVRVAHDMMADKEETLSGARIVEILESEPLNSEEPVVPGSADFIPILKEVLRKVPEVMLVGEETLAAEEKGIPFQDEISTDGTEAPALPELKPSQVQFHADASAAGVSGVATFERSRAPVENSTAAATADPPAAAVPKIKLDDATLRSVSRAIMGRLDIVDLVGKNTATEVAERVRDELLTPGGAERAVEVRKWVESEDAPFPSPPVKAYTAPPDALAVNLEAWAPRNFTTVSWSALEMLFDERQLKYYQEDADLPRFEDTTIGRRLAAMQKAAADGNVGTTDGNTASA